MGMMGSGGPSPGMVTTNDLDTGVSRHFCRHKSRHGDAGRLYAWVKAAEI
jgi:hypothetical protein